MMYKTKIKRIFSFILALTVLLSAISFPSGNAEAGMETEGAEENITALVPAAENTGDTAVTEDSFVLTEGDSEQTESSSGDEQEIAADGTEAAAEGTQETAAETEAEPEEEAVPENGTAEEAVPEADAPVQQGTVIPEETAEESSSGEVNAEAGDPVTPGEREDIETGNFTGLTAEKAFIFDSLDTQYVTVPGMLTAADDVCLDITVADPALIESQNLESEDAGDDIYILAHSVSSLRFYTGAEEDAYYVAALNPHTEVMPASLTLTDREETGTVYDSSALVYDAATGLVYLKKSLADEHYQALRLSVYYLAEEDDEPVNTAEAFISSFLDDGSVREPEGPVAVSGNLTDEAVELDLYEYLEKGLNKSMLTVYVNGYSEPLAGEKYSYGNSVLTVHLTPFAVRFLVVEIAPGDETMEREDPVRVRPAGIGLTGSERSSGGISAAQREDLVRLAGENPPRLDSWTAADMEDNGLSFYRVDDPTADDPLYSALQEQIEAAGIEGYPMGNGYVVLGKENAAGINDYGISNQTDQSLRIKPLLAVPAEDGWVYYPVLKIGSFCFYTGNENTSLHSVSLPDTVVEIGTNAFYKCGFDFTDTGGLFEIPKSVKVIGDNAFEEAAKIVNIHVLGEDVSIGDYAFKGCTGLWGISGVNVPEHDSIPAYDNQNTWCLHIGTAAFTGTKIGTSEITGTEVGTFVIPGSVRDQGEIPGIAEHAFDGMSYLTSVVFDSGDSALTVGKYAFAAEEGTGFTGCPSLASVDVKRRGLIIGEKAFQGVGTLTSFILSDAGASIKKIGNYAFQGTRLDSLTLPADIEEIGTGAFEETESASGRRFASFTVKEADADHALPSNPLVIGENAFRWAFRRDGESSVEPRESFVEIHVPVDLGAWSFADNGSIGSLVLGSGNVTVGDYAFKDAGSTGGPLGKEDSPLDLTGVVSFGSYSFYGSNIGYMALPVHLDSEAKAGVGAFKKAGLQKVVIPWGWYGSLPSGLFLENDGLTAVTLEAVPEGEEYENDEIDIDSSVSPVSGCTALEAFKDYREGAVGTDVFRTCTALKTFEAPYITEIGDGIFSGVVTLETVDISAAKEIGEEAFSGCTGIRFLKTLTAEKIGAKAFLNSGASELSPEQVPIDLSHATEIGEYAFSGSRLITGSVGNSGGDLDVILPAAGSSAVFGREAFSRTSAESVSITDLAIPERMFYYCTALETVTLDLAGDIGAQAFEGCTVLDDLQITRVQNIGDYAFDGCTALNDLQITQVQNIGEYAFSNCTGLKTAELTLTEDIGYRAFNQCTELETLEINGRDVGEEAFRECHGLTSITVTGRNIGKRAFSGAIYNGCTAEITLTGEVGESAFNSDGITSLRLTAVSVGTEAFYNCSELVSADLTGTGSIGDSAFGGCGKLEKLIVSPVTVGASAFKRCGGSTVSPDTNIDLTDTVSIGASAFEGCKLLGTVVLFDHAEGAMSLLGASAFKGSSVSALTLPERTPVSMEGGIFENCTNLSQVTVPGGWTRIPEGMFRGCSNLNTVTFNAGSEGLEIEGYAFHSTGVENLTVSRSGSVGSYAFAGCEDLTAVSLPNVTSVGDHAFDGSVNLTSVSIPRATSVGAYAFDNLTALSSLDLGSGLTGSEKLGVGAYAFRNAGSKDGIEILDENLHIDLTRISGVGDYAFAGCKLIRGDVTLTEGISVGNHAFAGAVFNNLQINGTNITNASVFSGAVLSGNVAVSGATLGASVFANAKFEALSLDNVTFRTDGTEAQSVFDGAVFGDLTLCNSKLAKYAFTGASFGKLTVNAPENPSATNHSTVGAYAFASSGSRKTTFEELLVAGEWTEIGTAAFYRCTGLTTVTVTGANVSIGESSFERISALASAALSTGTVGKYAFKNCTSLSSLGASSVSSVGQSAFEGCTQLTAADVQNAVTVGSSAFSGCTSLAAVNAQSAQSIGDDTFKNCSLLADVNIQSALSIGNSAFTGCSSLKTIDAQSARSIGSSTFYGLISLETVNISDAASIGGSAFEGCTGIKNLTMRSAVTVGDKAFKNAGCQPASVTGANGTGNYIDPKDMTGIGVEAFRNCRLIGGEIILDLAATTVGTGAFAETAFGDLKLTNSEDTVKSIGGRVFEDAVFGVFRITGNKINVGADAFNSATMKKVSVSGNSNTFAGHALSGATIYDEESEEGVIEISGSDNTFSSCVGSAYGTAPNNVSAVQFDRLTVNGSGAVIQSNAFEEAQFETFTVNGSGISVGEDAFKNAKFETLDITAYGSAAEFAANSFTGAEFKTFTVNGSGTSFGENAFKNAKFEQLQIGGSNTSIGNTAFYESVFVTAQITGSGTVIGNEAFRRAAFDNLYITPSMITIGNYAFAESGIRTLRLPGNEPAEGSLGEYIFYSCQNLTTDLTTETGFRIPEAYRSGVGYDGLEGLLLDGTIPNRRDKSAINSSGSIVPAAWTYLPKGFFYGCNGIRFLYLRNITKVADYVYCTKGDANTSIAACDSDKRLYHTVVWFSSCLESDAISEHAFQKENPELGIVDSDPSYIEIYLKQNPFGSVQNYRNGWGSVDISKYWIRWKETFNNWGPMDTFSEPRIEYNRVATPSTPHKVVDSRGSVDIVIYNYLGYYNNPDYEQTYHYDPEDDDLEVKFDKPLTESSGESQEEWYYLNVDNAFDPASAESKPAGLYTTELVAVNFGVYGYTADPEEEVYYTKYYERIRLRRTAEDPIDETDYRYALFRYGYYDENNAYTYNEEISLSDEDKTRIPGYWTGNRGMDWNQFMEILGSKTGELGGITVIGTEAFKVENALTEDAFTSIWIPVTITAIENNAYEGQELLVSVPNLSKCILSGGIGERAFTGCIELPEIRLNTVAGGIGTKAFENCSGLTLFESGLAGDIGTLAFTGCSSLKTVTFTDTVGVIGVSAFRSCRSLEAVSFGASVNTIKANAFTDCTGLKTFTVVGTVDNGTVADDIENEAFRNCSKLKTVTFGGAVQSIGSKAFIKCFTDCDNQGTVVFRSGAGSIGSYAFSGCTGLKSFASGWDSGSGFTAADIGAIGEYAFSACAAEGTSACTGLKTFTAANTGNIGSHAFTGCTGLVTFTAVNTGDIGINAFEGCSSLTDFILGTEMNPGSTGNIGTYAFYNCGKLSGFRADTVALIDSAAFLNCFSNAAYAGTGCQVQIGTIPGTGIRIWHNAFRGCTYLKNVTVGMIGSAGTPGSIGSGAFSNCTGLESFTVGTADVYGPVADLGGQNDGTGVFEGCSSLKNVNVSHMDNIGAYAFLGCSSLGSDSDGKKFEITEFGGDGEAKGLIGRYAFSGCTFKVFKVSNGTVTKIDNYAFSAGPDTKKGPGSTVRPACTDLTEVQINKVLSIQTGVFQCCTALTTINIDEIGAEGKTAIGDDAFKDCDALTDVTLKKVIGTIGENAFAECNELARFTVNAGNIETLGGAAAGETGSIFYHCPKLTDIVFGDSETPDAVSCYVGQVSMNAFRNQTALKNVYFEKVGTFGKTAFYGCGNLQQVVIDEAGTIGMQAFESCGGSQTVSDAEAGMKVDIGTVGTISQSAFANCTKLRRVDIDKVTTLGKQSFYNSGDFPRVDAAYAGMKVNITDAGTVGDSAFMTCGCLKEVVFGKVETIDNKAFMECPQLKRAEIPGAKSVGNYAFNATGTAYPNTVWADEADYPGLEIPGTLAKIGMYAFRNCCLLTEAKLDARNGENDVVTSIGKYAFLDCPNIKSVKLPANIPATLGVGIFMNCSSLPEAVIPANWSTVRQEMFSGCSVLKKVTFPAVLRVIEKDAFKNTASSYTEIGEVPGIIWAADGGWWQLRTVGESAFETSKLIKAVHFQGGSSRTERMYDIGTAAFKGSSITSLTLPDEEPVMLVKSVTDARSDLFMNCISLTGTVTVPAGWDCVSEGMFSGSYLSKLLVEGRYGTELLIRKRAFAKCPLLSEITINGVADLAAGSAADENGAFYRCGTDDSVTSIELTVNARPDDTYGAAGDDLPMSTVNEYAFRDCTKLSDVTLNYVKAKGNAFKGCFGVDDESLKNQLTVTEKAEFSGTVFEGCTYLKQAEVQGSAKFTGAVFDNCVYLDHVTVKKAEFTEDSNNGGAVFRNCSRLNEVKVTEAADFTGTLFTGCDKLKKITVDPGVTDRNKATRFIGKSRASQGILTGAGAGLGADEGIELSITGEAQIYSYAFAASEKLKSVGMDQVTKIGAFSFWNGGLKTVSANSLTEVPKGAFKSDTGLTSVTLPVCTTVGESAFQGDTGLTSVTLPACQTVGKSAFEGDRSLVTVSAEAVTQIGVYAFKDCTSLIGTTVHPAVGEDYTALYFPALKILGAKPTAEDDQAVNDYGIWTIDRYAHCDSGSFMGCTALERVEMPVIEIIGNNAFSGCSSLQFCNKVTQQTIRDRDNVPIYGMDKDLFTLGNELRLDMSKLPGSLHYLGAYAFNGTKLRNVYVVPNWPVVTDENGTYQRWWWTATEDPILLSNNGEDRWDGQPRFADLAMEGLGSKQAETPYIFIQLNHDSIKGCPWSDKTELLVDWHDCIMYDKASNLWYKYNDIDNDNHGGVVGIVQVGLRTNTAFVIPEKLPDGMGNRRDVRRIGAGNSNTVIYTECFEDAVNYGRVRVVLNDGITDILKGAFSIGNGNCVKDIQIPQYKGTGTGCGPLTEADILRGLTEPSAGADLTEIPAGVNGTTVTWLERPSLELEITKKLEGFTSMESEAEFAFLMGYRAATDKAPAGYGNGFRTLETHVNTGSSGWEAAGDNAKSKAAKFPNTVFERGNRSEAGIYDGKYISVKAGDPDNNNGQVYYFRITELESEGGDFAYFTNAEEELHDEKALYAKVSFTRVTNPEAEAFSINYTVQVAWYKWYDNDNGAVDLTTNLIVNEYYLPVRLVYDLNNDGNILGLTGGYKVDFEDGMLGQFSISYAQPMVIQRGIPRVEKPDGEAVTESYVFAGWSTKKNSEQTDAIRFTKEEDLIKPEKTDIRTLKIGGKPYPISEDGKLTLYAIWKSPEKPKVYTRYGSDGLYTSEGTAASAVTMPNRYGYENGNAAVGGLGFRIDTAVTGHEEVHHDYQAIGINGKLAANVPDEDTDEDFVREKYSNAFLIYVDRKWRWGAAAGSDRTLKAYWTRRTAKLAKLVLKKEVVEDGVHSWETIPMAGGKEGYVAYNKPGIFCLTAEELEEFNLETATGVTTEYFTGAMNPGTTTEEGVFLGWYTARDGGMKVVNADGTLVMPQGNEIPGWVIRSGDNVNWVIANVFTDPAQYTERTLYAHFGTPE